MKPIKILTIILSTLCITTASLFPNNKQIGYSDFQKKTDWEKWVYFQTALTEAKRFSDAYKIVSGLYKQSEKELERQLKKEFKPRWGFSLTASANLNNNFDGTITINNNYQIYFFKRFYISPGICFSLGKNLSATSNVFGGGISFGFGLIFE
ncbi:MAG TPA: hypothetical protein PLO89_00100 [Spirochaetota bacterium]|nr:hypothetical protein [Spirochaetota bacterium]